MAKNARKNIFVTWFPMYHGLSYLKHILAKFYDGTISPTGKINLYNIDQDKTEVIWEERKSGFYFDKVYVITPSEELHRSITTITQEYKRNEILNDIDVKNSGYIHLWEKILDQHFDSIKKEIEFIKQNFQPQQQKIILSQYWRNIQHYSISDQIWWLEHYSNLPDDYFQRFVFLRIAKNELKAYHTYKEVTEVTLKFVQRIKKAHRQANYIFHLGVSGHIVPIAFYNIANAGLLPYQSRFIEAYDIKNSNPGHRFQKFFIREIPTRLLEDITTSLKLYSQKPSSQLRQAVQKKFIKYFEQGFSILLLGERGIGKSHLAKTWTEKQKIKFVPVNCASFIDSHIAEAELFGYKKGAFTDARSDKKGLIEEADGGVLFMDEVHTLPKDVQFKLMRAFATDEENRMTIRRLGDTKERKIRLKALIFATNRNIDELRKILLPDFFDRIAQLVIELPPLRETPEEIIPAFRQIWDQLRFEDLGYAFDKYPGKDKALLNWLKTVPLYGNYRDLQRIAMYYKAYLQFDDELKKLLQEKSPYQYAKNQFERYVSTPEPSQINLYFRDDLTTKQMIEHFKKDLAQWAIKRFGSAPKAVQHFESLGEKITKESLYHWRNNVQKE